MQLSLIHRAPGFFKPISNQLIWEIQPVNNEVFLTFDDGPHPTITPWVLSELKKYNMKGTFFLVGENAKKYPEVVKQIIAEGHHIGNHTFNHLNGWTHSAFKYYRNTLKCDSFIDSPLFRPPYGRITRSQHRKLSKRYKIIMWSVLSGDYDRSISPERISEGVLKNTVPGSVIVFHDSEKAEKNLKHSLPTVLEGFVEMNYHSMCIPYDLENSHTVRGQGKRVN
ncbi:MAG: peptidoglycan/xylan/chitin deacetylase (PgdA/CDA1 family) [Salibacteraceae bacterium]|jgi:peptidoglycan/xylan/chitin deacetylase (PgdA/CDA1 family)